MPANDGRWTHVDHRIAPIEESGEQREADPSHVIHASGFDATLNVPSELSAKNQILSADRAGRAQKQDSQPQDVPDDSDDCSRQLQHPLIMPESARARRRPTATCPRHDLLRTTRVRTSGGPYRINASTSVEAIVCGIFASDIHLIDKLE